MSSRIHKVWSDGIYIRNICQAPGTSLYNNKIQLPLSVNEGFCGADCVHLGFTHTKTQTGQINLSGSRQSPTPAQQELGFCVQVW